MYEQFLNDVKLTREPGTYEQYYRILSLFEDKPINIDTAKEIMNMNISMNTKKQYLTTWINALHYQSIECKDIEKFTKGIRFTEKIIQVPTKEEVEKIINSINDTKMKLVIGLMSYAGLRINEVINLLEKDVDFKKNILIVRSTKNHTDRACPINAQLKRLFREWFSCSERIVGEYVFCSPRGGSFSNSYFKNNIRILCNELGFKGFHCHSFRHFFATMVYKMSGNDIHLTAKACGHKSINTTMRYINSNVDDIADIVKLF